MNTQVDKDDIKPKIICENCHTALSNWTEMKSKAAESQIVINYIAKKKVTFFNIIFMQYLFVSIKIIFGFLINLIIVLIFFK